MNKAEFDRRRRRSSRPVQGRCRPRRRRVASASITKALKKGDSVTLVGFGTFQVRKRAARTGRNPRTGEDDQDHGFEESGVQGWQGAEGCRKLIGPAEMLRYLHEHLGA